MYRNKYGVIVAKLLSYLTDLSVIYGQSVETYLFMDWVCEIPLND